MTITVIALIMMLALVQEACRKDDAGPNPPSGEAMKLDIPPGFPQPENIFSNNPLTREGFELGRKLFYDGRLSRDGNFPCASCHQQFAAFSTFDHALSHGIDDQFTTRNAPGLFNLAWYKELHWDGGINHLEVQPLAPISAPNEMGETMDNIIVKLNQDASYPQMFHAAFGNNTINSQRILKALAQFMGMMVSAGSKYDAVKNGKTTFTPAEESGYAIFRAKCETCHREPLFTDLSYRNTGLPVNTFLKDRGRMRITNASGDSLKFKVPSLRNVFLTAPYGHDGRFYSIGAVLDHYRTGVVDGLTTDPLVRGGISISSQERYDLQQFLRTLTDTAFVKNPLFAQPQ